MRMYANTLKSDLMLNVSHAHVCEYP